MATLYVVVGITGWVDRPLRILLTAHRERSEAQDIVDNLKYIEENNYSWDGFNWKKNKEKFVKLDFYGWEIQEVEEVS